MSVKTWAQFQIWKMPDDLRTALVARADEEQVSMADLIREALCEEMELECEHPRRRTLTYPRVDSTQSASFPVRMSPELLEALRNVAAERGSSVNALVLGVLADRYQEVFR